MAPNKKKKKAAANPARGFATTSVVSKSKAQSDTEPTEIAKNENVKKTQAEEDGSVTRSQEAQPGKQIDLGKLSPEDLEHHLEESELQNLLEQHAERCKQDAKRQVSRLHTEKRLLRSQADHLIVQSWLPNELMQLIESMLQSQFQNIVSASTPNKAEQSRTSPGDTLLLRLWTLEQALTGLGFQRGKARDAIFHVLQRRFGQASEPVAARDTLWGLEECLDWLACFCEAEELPDYTVDTIRSLEKLSNKHEDEDDSEVENPTQAPRNSELPAIFPKNPKASSELGNEVEIQDQTPLSSSGSEEDDPKVMGDRYLTLLTKLYSFRPDLADIVTDSRASNLKKRSGKHDPAFERLGPYATRLVHKVSQIQDDILFDRDEAQSRWIEMRNELARDAAERRRLQLGRESACKPISKAESQSSPMVSEGASPKKDGSDLTSEDTSDTLEDLFSSLPELSIDANAGALGLQTVTRDSDHVFIRDFGNKHVGLKPRRVLEDACKAR